MGAQQSSGGLGNLFTSTAHHVVMLGLDSAGKTTVLYRTKFEQYVNTVPTVGFNCEKVKGQVGKSKGVYFTVWDIGGQDKLRPLWNTYIHHTEGIIFVVDSCDHERFEEARIELMKIAKNAETIGVPIVIVANKQDLPNARSVDELERSLTLHELTGTHPWTIFPAIAVIGEGLFESVNSLYEMMVKAKKSKGKHKSASKR